MSVFRGIGFADTQQPFGDWKTKMTERERTAVRGTGHVHPLASTIRKPVLSLPFSRNPQDLLQQPGWAELSAGGHRETGVAGIQRHSFGVMEAMWNTGDPWGSAYQETG